MSRGLRPNSFTFAPVVSSLLLDPHCGNQLHCLILKSGLIHSDAYAATALLGFFGRSRRLDDAVKLFDEMPAKTVVTWNVVISMFSQMGFVADSMRFFRELMRSAIGLSECSVLSILSAFRSLDRARSVDQVRGLTIKTALDSFVVVTNSLLNAYCNCCGVHSAVKLFDELAVRDAVSWNTMITAFAKSSTPEKALELFFVMSSEGLSLTETTFTSVLNACSGLCVPEFGKIIHAKAVKRNLHTSTFGGSSLIDFYSKCSLRNDARKAFDEISEKNIVSWNSLLNVYSDEDSCASLGVLKETLCFGFKPNEISFSSVLRTASCLVLRQLHSLVIRMGYDNNDYVSSAIIASYASNGNDSDALACGSALDSQLSVVATNAIAGIYNRSSRFQESKELLLRLETPDVVSWNVLLTACARNGDYAQAFDLFNHMRTLGHSVDKYTATSLLSICSKINNLSMGKSLHGLLVKTNAGSSDTLVHNILLDMYVKCGSLECCVKVFDEMDERNLISWTAVISGLGLHGRPHEALIWFKRMEEEGFVPDNVALLAVLSACRHGGLVEEGLRLFECMKAKYRVEPEMDHYVCVVDLLCKYGRLREAELVIDEMPFQPNAVIWRMFLQGCKRYGVEAIGG